jgi:hypothetical protein
MTLEHVKRVIFVYVDLFEKGRVKSHKYTINGILPTYGAALSHARWMCQQVALMDDVGKSMRWLGFIQGILWVTGRRTIDEMRDDNRSS